MSDNFELFAAEHAELGQLIDRLDSIPPEELRNKWPQTLADLLDVIAVELERVKVDNATLIASKLAVCIAHYLGGRAVYLPTGEALNSALRDYDIYANWRGNIDGLIDKYGLTQSHIYSILRQQRQLHRRRYQMDLFASSQGESK